MKFNLTEAKLTMATKAAKNETPNAEETTTKRTRNKFSLEEAPRAGVEFSTQPEEVHKAYLVLCERCKANLPPELRGMKITPASIVAGALLKAAAEED